MTKSDYLSAREAAASLGISVTTLYAYVSRGLIRSEATAGNSRARRYLSEDVTALLARKALRRDPTQAAARALSWGAPVLESGITLIEDGRLYYRGHDVIRLPQRHTVADVAQLIWRGELTTGQQFDRDEGETDWLTPALKQLLLSLSFVDRFQLVLPLAAASDLAAFDLQPGAVIRSGQRLLATMTRAVTGHAVTGPLEQELQAAWQAADRVRPLLKTALIYCADHELNVSAFTARTVASARANPYAVVLGGLAALQGSLHGGATERVDALFREIGHEAAVRTALASRLRRGDDIPGFGHPLYADGDPRGAALLTAVAQAYPRAAGVRLAQAVAAETARATGQQPNIDFALVTLAWAGRLPRDAPLALFALGRTIGWLGHALEQYGRDQLIRPRARYTGPPPHP